jgi:hypothetical protein
MASAYLFAMLALAPSESREVALIANPEFEAGRVAGHRARRLIDGANPAFSDPFLLMAEDWVPRDAFSRHPHRGIETVTLVLDGALAVQMNAEGRPTQRFFSILLGQTVALGENARHFRHVLGSPGTKRDDRDGQAAAERGQRVVHVRGVGVSLPKRPKPCGMTCSTPRNRSGSV